MNLKQIESYARLTVKQSREAADAVRRLYSAADEHGALAAHRTLCEHKRGDVIAQLLDNPRHVPEDLTKDMTYLAGMVAGLDFSLKLKDATRRILETSERANSIPEGERL